MADLTHRARSALGERLRELRKAAGLTGAQLADVLGDTWDQPKVSRIERGKQIPTGGDLEAWCAATGGNLEELTAMAERAAAEYHTFAHRITEVGGVAEFQAAIGAAETAAARIGQYEPMMVMGILQTAEYAREMLRLDGGPVVHGASEDDIGRAVAARLRRQAILHEPGREIILVLTEASLRTRVASPATMAGQCEHIGQLAATLGTAAIGVIPFSARPPMATLHGWSILDDLVTIETEGGPLEIADPLEVERYWRYTRSLLGASLTGQEAAALCRQIASEHGAA